VTLVIGIGNPLRRDDGVGLKILERLKGMELPEKVRLLDGGTAGIDLVPYLEGVDRLIIVDAVAASGKPGEIRVLQEKDVPAGYCLSGHYGGLRDIIGMAAALWQKPETTVVGIVPADCESYEIGLSEAVSEAVGEAARLIAEML
jgi:hydrogenase maturation protease